jgi:hypothetical protein
VKLGDWLVSRGKLTQEQLARALQDKAFFNARLGTSLLKLGYIDEDMLGEYLADVSRTRYCPSQRLEAISPDVIATVPARVAAKYLVVPFAIETRKLHLAMRDPKDLMALDEIAFLTGLPIEPYVATEFRIQRAIERYYRIRLGTESIPVTPAPVPRPGRPVERQPPPVGPAGPEIGLDGLPIDADPGDLDQPFVTPTAAPPAMDSQGPLPASLDAWRAAQEEAGAPPPGSPEAAPRAGATQPVSPMAPHPVAIPGPAARAGRPAAARPAPAEAARGGPPTLETITSRLREAETRDDVFEAVLDFTSTHFSRSALFVVQQDRVLGWSGRGEGLFAARIRNVIVPLNRPSLFVFFRSGGDYFYGPVPDLPANAKFYLDLGCPPPARVFLLPLTIQGRTAVILYADYGQTAGRQPDVPVLRRLLMKASLALEVLILRNKIMMI